MLAIACCVDYYVNSKVWIDKYIESIEDVFMKMCDLRMLQDRYFTVVRHSYCL